MASSHEHKAGQRPVPPKTGLSGAGFADNKPWQKEIKGMLNNGFKMEVEGLITKDISYVTETYVPERLAAEDWLG